MSEAYVSARRHARRPAAVDAWRHEYNHDRPHQSLDMATPASRFRLRPPEADDGLSLWAPADLEPLAGPPAAPEEAATAAEPASRCVEVDRLVTGTGGVTLLNRLILVGSPLAGQRARIRLDGQLIHVITQDGVLWRTLPAPSRPASATASKGCAWPGPPRPSSPNCCSSWPSG